MATESTSPGRTVMETKGKGDSELDASEDHLAVASTTPPTPETYSAESASTPAQGQSRALEPEEHHPRSEATIERRSHAELAIEETA